MADSASNTPAVTSGASSTSIPNTGDAAEDHLNAALAEMTAEGVLDDTGAVTERADPATDGSPDSTNDATVSPETKPDATPSAETPAAAAPPGTTEDAKPDPLEGTEPFTYEIDGQVRQFKGILLADGGGLIPPEALDGVRQSLAYADRAIQQNRALTEQVERTNALTFRAKDDAGQDRDFQGTEAFHRLKAEYARIDAEGHTIVGSLGDPQFVINLALAYQDGNKAAALALIKNVTERVHFAGERAHFTSIRDVQQTTQKVTTDAQEAQVVDQALNAQIDAMGRWATAQGVPLTAADLDAARKHFGPFKGALHRDATADELRQYGWKPGQKVIDTPRMHGWFEDRMALRKDAIQRDKDKAAADAARAKSQTFNSGQDKGRQPARQTKPATPAAPPAPQPDTGRPREKVSHSRAWDDAFDEAMTEINLPTR